MFRRNHSLASRESRVQSIAENTGILCTFKSLRFMVTQNMDTTLDLILRKPCRDLFSAMFAKCCTTPDMYANAITRGRVKSRPIQDAGVGFGMA